MLHVKIKVEIDGVIYDAHLEERLIYQWPDQRYRTFVVLDNLEVHRFPIEINNFKNNYGKIITNE